MKRSARGFTLLEAIVALAVLAAGTMAIFAALSGALRSVERAEAAATARTATLNALAHLEQVNPMEHPTGEVQLGGAMMSWRASLLEPVSPVLTDYLQPGLFDIGLYDVEVLVEIDGRVARRFVVRRAGWSQVREPAVL